MQNVGGMMRIIFFIFYCLFIIFFRINREIIILKNMIYEGLLLLRASNIPINTIFVVNDDCNFVVNNKQVILDNINKFTQNYTKFDIQFINPQTFISDDELKFLLKNRFKVEDNMLDPLVEKARNISNFNFWDVLRSDNIDFKCDDSYGFNAFVVLAFNENQNQIYRFSLKSETDSLDLGRLLFNEYDCVVRPKFEGFGSWPFDKMPIQSKPSPNVDVPLNQEAQEKLELINERISTIVDTIKNLDREEGISWLKRALGDNLLENLEIPEPTISGLKVDDNFNLLLTDFGDTEVKIDPLTKSFYYMFLIHTEGVAYRYLEKYEKAVLELYKMISNRSNVDKMEQSVKYLLGYDSEIMPQKISRLRRTFTQFFPKSIVEKYYMPQYINDEQYWTKKVMLEASKIEVSKELDCIRKIKINLPKVKKEKSEGKYITGETIYKPEEIHHDDDGSNENKFIILT